MPEPDPLPLPSSTADVIRKKARRVYITYARFLGLGPTPGCSACENDRSNHSAECTACFEAAYGGEKETPPTPALRRIPSTPSLPPPTAEEDHSGRFEVGTHLDFVEEVQADRGLLLATLNLTPLRKQMTFRLRLSSLVLMMQTLLLLLLRPCIGINYPEL